MSRHIWLLAAVALHSCPRSDDRRTGAAVSASSTAAAASSAAPSGDTGGEPAPLAGRPPPEAEADAGVREGSGTMIACGRNVHLSCHFHGRVRSLRATVLEPGERPIRQLRFRERATEVILDDVPGLECASTEIRGIQLESDGSDGQKRREGPVFAAINGEAPMVQEIMITLDRRYRLPFSAGDVICGSVIAFSIGYSVEREWLIARPNGDVLLAFGGMMPRDPSPAAGWTFKLGPRTERGYSTIHHDLRVTHGGVSISIPIVGEPVLLRAPDGEFSIDGMGYVTVGHLSVPEGYLAKQGYSFSIVRVGEGTRSNGGRAP